MHDVAATKSREPARMWASTAEPRGFDGALAGGVDARAPVHAADVASHGAPRGRRLLDGRAKLGRDTIERMSFKRLAQPTRFTDAAILLASEVMSFPHRLGIGRDGGSA